MNRKKTDKKVKEVQKILVINVYLKEYYKKEIQEHMVERFFVNLS